MLAEAAAEAHDVEADGEDERGEEPGGADEAGAEDGHVDGQEHPAGELEAGFDEGADAVEAVDLALEGLVCGVADDLAPGVAGGPDGRRAEQERGGGAGQPAEGEVGDEAVEPAQEVRDGGDGGDEVEDGEDDQEHGQLEAEDDDVAAEVRQRALPALALAGGEVGDPAAVPVQQVVQAPREGAPGEGVEAV